MNNTLASSAANIVTIVIGVAFFAVTAVGIAQPVHAQTTVATTPAR
ncbi:hypothetical protein [Sphingomonas sp. SUN039]|nr:hypothetical protein [Sphingomonas sp. SUN039]UVO54806.1 hypothetical protein M0209_11995 [Sphingomonas sp. SUN039]